MPAPVVVSSLLGHNQLTFALPCLQSLLTACADPIRLRVHDDGTLTPGDRAAIAGALDPVETVGREEADERAAEALRGLDRCARFRATNPLALKLIDLALWGDGQIRYCDADVLFVRRFAGLFTSSVERAVFMRDRQNAYSVSPRHLWRSSELRLAAFVNSGVVVAPRAFVDFERVEWLLAQPDLRPAVWLEQTCWAMLGAGRSDLLERRQFAIPRSLTSAPILDAIAIHFVSPVRSLLTKALEAPLRLDDAVMRVRTGPAGRCTAASLVLGALRRRLGRR